jgi:cytochrome o ubiquinol oxidase subunit 2
MAPGSGGLVLRRNIRLGLKSAMAKFRIGRAAFAAPLLASLAGCKMVVMDPAGDVAAQQRDLILLSTGLMLLIIVPVIAMTLFFAWKYRASSKSATYDPEFTHSTKIEVAVWGAPMAIILVLGTVTWVTSHKLDPYRPIDRLAPHQPVAAGAKPLEVDVVALDWKWLFIYPEQGVATVNELALPVDRPVAFKITASNVMNSFYAPALAGQVYAMPGMQTQLHAVLNKPGQYEGFSANYSGAGFSGMRFKLDGMSQADFDRWAAGMRAKPAQLTRADYQALAQPSQNDPVRLYGGVDPTLFLDIVNRCSAPGQVCKDRMPHQMAQGADTLAQAGKVLCADKGRRTAAPAPRPLS